MNPLRQSPQRGCTLEESRPKKGGGGGKHPGPTYFVLGSRAGGCWRLSRWPRGLVSALPRLLLPLYPTARGGPGTVV